jgi:hypothetical protein
VTFDVLVLLDTLFVWDIDLTEVFDFVSDLDDEELVARFDNPNRWTLPITAFRVTPPSSLAI